MCRTADLFPPPASPVTPARASDPTAREEDIPMSNHLDHLVAQSIAHERERDLRKALLQRQHGAARRRHGRHVAVARQHPLRARLAHLWAPAH